MATVRLFTTDRSALSAASRLAFDVEIFELRGWPPNPTEFASEIESFELPGWPPNPTESPSQLETMIAELRSVRPTNRVTFTVSEVELLASPEVQEIAEIASASGLGCDIFVATRED